MKILRSQYLQWQNNADHHATITKKDNQVVSKATEHADGNEKIVLSEEHILHRRESVTCFKVNSKPNAPNIRIVFNTVDTNLKQLNLVLEYTDMSSSWLSKVYKTYENDLWHRKAFLNIHGDKKWDFHCGLCNNVYKKFESLKRHLNLHLQLYPYVCKACHKKYTSRSSATRHLRKVHHLDRERWNNFLTS